MPQSKPFLLSVLAGPNAGASATFGTSKLQLGGGPEDQIILAGLAPDSLALRAEGTRLRLSARFEGMTAHDPVSRHLVPLPTGGAVHQMDLPATLRLSRDTVISISRLGAEKRLQLGLPSVAGLAAVALALGLWIGANSDDGTPALSPDGMALAAPPTLSLQPDPANSAAQVAAITATSPRMSCPEDCITEAAALFQDQLHLAGLDGLNVLVENGILRVTGALPNDRTESWRQLRTRFESEFGQSLPLVVQVQESGNSPILAVSSVWLGNAPEIRTKSGTVLRIGDTTGDGWVIRAIRKGEILLERGTQSTTVRF